MKLGQHPPEAECDDIDLHILTLLQENCKLPLAKIGEKVGLSAPSVIDRIKKLEDQHVIMGYRAVVDARRVGKDVTAFIGVSVSHPKLIGEFEQEIVALDDVLECHHVTGQHTLLVKVKTANTSSLEDLISRIRSIEGVDRTETMVVLSTHTERTQITIPFDATAAARRSRRNGEKRADFKGV